jgi:hypothetical protein
MKSNEQEGTSFPMQQPFHESSIFTVLTGPLPGGRHLSKPITVKIEEGDGEYITGELKYYIHGEGSTIPQSIEAFKRIFSRYLDILSEEEANLSPYMHEQLEYLRSVIRVD